MSGAVEAAKAFGIRWRTVRRRVRVEGRDRHYRDMGRCLYGVMQAAYWLLYELLASIRGRSRS